MEQSPGELGLNRWYVNGYDALSRKVLGTCRGAMAKVPMKTLQDCEWGILSGHRSDNSEKGVTASRAGDAGKIKEEMGLGNHKRRAIRS